MTVKFLTSMLEDDTIVIIKKQKTGKILFEGLAKDARFRNEVKDWNFLKNHIIYI